jgi:hypothetical protein
MSISPANQLDSAVAPFVRDAIVRAVAVVGLMGVALIHVLDAHDTFADSAYKGWLYVGLIAGTTATAAVLVRRSDPRAWAAAAALCAGAFVVFVVSRTIGLPQGADDIGNWWEPLGLASLFVEGSVVALSVAVLAERVRVAAPRRVPAVRPRPGGRLERSFR